MKIHAHEQLDNAAAKKSAWIEALRLRTLPLAAAGVVIAGGIGAFYHQFSWFIFIPMLLMALAMQILSNFADEYGDLVNGVDDDDRLGPIRGLQRGDITKDEMKRAMVITSGIINLLALLTIYASFGTSNWLGFFIFLVLELCCVAAAILYTIGPKPYGYIGLGDLISFIFFGVVAVVGGTYLYTHTLDARVLLPAVGLGLPVIAVLNLNNMRDCETDKSKGKVTIANLLGDPLMRYYQAGLLIVSMLLFALYPLTVGATNPLCWLFIIGYLGWIKTIQPVLTLQDRKAFDRLMKPTAGVTVIVAVLFTLCTALFA